MSQVQIKQEVFYEIVKEFVEENNFVISEEQIESCGAIYEALEEFFVENYHHYTLEEQVYSVVRGIDINEELAEVLYETLLDESIGSAIATAVHGIGQKVSQIKANRAKATADKMNNRATSAAAKAGGMAMKAKSVEKKNDNSVAGNFKSSFAKARANNAQNKASEARKKAGLARFSSREADVNLSLKNKKKEALANKIDTKINNAKSAVKSGIKKAAGFAGRIAGRLA